MNQVTPEFMQAVYSPIRSVTARVTFDISDVTAAEDNTKTVTGEAEISRKDQLTNQKWSRPKYATFEPDYWKLDGSFSLPPKVDEVGYEVGWYSDDLCDSDGVFSPYQEIDFTFSEIHSSIGLTVSFDLAADEYATDFDIEAYDSEGVLIKTIQVRGNTKSRHVTEEGIAEYKRIKVIIQKWSKGNRRAKVIEVSFGVVREYADDKLIKVSLIEQIDPTSANVPANELRFTVDNSSREFNILNPEGSYQYLQERQLAVLEIGVEVAPGIYEYVGMGHYYLSDWQSDEGSLTTTFTARDRIDFIRNEEVENLVPQSTNLYALALSVIQAIGIKNYRLDAALLGIETQGVYKKQTYRQLLQNIAVSGQCVMYVDRDDFLVIERLSNDDPVDTIDFDNIYREPQIKLDKLVSRVEVNYYSGEEVSGTHAVTGAVNGGVTLKVENTLISSLEHAEDVAAWIMSESDNRALFEVNWRQNPALECGDIVTIEDIYGSNKQSRIVSQEYEYAGYLSGKTKSKGAV
jgi:hypothetical protein